MSYVFRAADGSKLPMKLTGDNVVYGDGPYAVASFDLVDMPTEFAVAQGYPNPFNPSITVPFALPNAGEVTFRVFNVLGQEVFNSTRNYEIGHHRFLFDANNAGSEIVSGVYFLQVEYTGQVKTQKLMLLK